MENFTFHCPTKLFFGNGVIESLAEFIETKGYRRVLFVYGQNSIKNNGVYDLVVSQLKTVAIEIVEHSGVMGNPRLSHALTGVELAKQNSVDFVLAVGGGSVIDEAKAIAVGAKTDIDLWDFYLKKEVVAEALPVITVLTLPATGSEMNGISVLQDEVTQTKTFINAPSILHPVASFLDPTTTYSLPNSQTAYACADILSHLTEFYLTTSAKKMPVQDNLVEGVARSLIEAMHGILKNPTDYNARAQFMWCATLGWCQILHLGMPDISTPCHGIEMPLSAIYDIAHGAGLSIVTPAWMRYAKDLHRDRLLQFGRNILAIETDSVDAVADDLIKLYKEIGAPTSLAEAGIDDVDTAEIASLVTTTFRLRGITGYDEAGIASILEESKG